VRSHFATDTIEYQNSDKTDESCRDAGDDLGKLVNNFILCNEQDRENNDAIHDDAEHDSQHAAHLQTHTSTQQPVTILMSGMLDYQQTLYITHSD